MVKKISSLLVLAIFGIIYSNKTTAQNLMNPDFEQTDTINSFPFPANWDGDPYGSGVSTLAQNGSYAISIWNWYYYAKAYAVNGNMPGFGLAHKAGTPYTQKATKLNGFYRYDTTSTYSENDSAIVAVLLKKYNTSTQQVDTVGYGIAFLSSYSPGDNSFASFEVNITDMQPGVQPDSIVVYLQSSINGFCANSSPGNCLYLTVDNISLETPLGVTDLSGKPIQPEIYPNPSSGIVTVSLQGIDIETVNVYSSIGSMVYHQNNLLANNIKIDLSSAEKGFYFVELLDKNGQSYSSKIVIE